MATEQATEPGVGHAVGMAAADGDGRPGTWPSLLLVAVFIVGFMLVSSVVLVRGRLLDAGLYTDALARTDAYERVYTEVLADPELAELTEDLLGGLGVEAVDPTQVRVLATSSLRLGLPPSSLQRGTEAFIRTTLAYLRGDTERLDGDIDVREVLGRTRDSGVAWARTRLAVARDRVAPSVERYRAAVDSFADQLEAGTVPDAIPVVGGTAIDAAEILDVIDDRPGPGVGPRVREQIRAAVLSGDERSALIEATTHLIAGHADDATADLRGSLEDRRELDVIGEIAERANRSQAAVVDQLNTVRDAAGWLRPPIAVAGVAIMSGATVGVVWLNRRRPRRAGFLLAAAAIASGLTIVVLWLIARVLIVAPLAPATEAGPGSWNLPVGVRSVLGDVVSTLAGELTRTIRRLALVPIAAGAALAAGITLAPRLRRLSPTRALPSPTPAVAVGVTAAAVVGLVAWFGVSPVTSREPRACNGDAELCDRPYDEVVFPATHNSMSSPDVVRIWPEHDGDIRAQLDHGIRALLIDTHLWTPLVSDEQLAAANPFLPADVAEQIFDRLGPLRAARDGTYLCHNQCALGAIPFVDTLRTIREFLDENPDEVVTLIVQDAITPAETADAFSRAGLDPYLHEHELGTPWATLGELIDRDERLVVFAEEEGPPPAWYHQAFENMQETPFRFEEPEDFSCDPNRGDPEASLFLLNHWVQRTAPDRADAVAVNSHDAIVERARACRRQRGLIPNFVAVNFYSLGDVTGAVATLNGLD